MKGSRKLCRSVIVIGAPMSELWVNNYGRSNGFGVGAAASDDCMRACDRA
jgi:hypothetical protein